MQCIYIYNSYNVYIHIPIYVCVCVLYMKLYQTSKQDSLWTYTTRNRTIFCAGNYCTLERMGLPCTFVLGPLGPFGPLGPLRPGRIQQEIDDLPEDASKHTAWSARCASQVSKCPASVPHCGGTWSCSELFCFAQNVSTCQYCSKVSSTDSIPVITLESKKWNGVLFCLVCLLCKIFPARKLHAKTRGVCHFDYSSQVDSQVLFPTQSTNFPTKEIAISWWCWLHLFPVK